MGSSSGRGSRWRKVAIAPFLALLYLYRGLISPLLPSACRFTPTCSRYAIEAYKKHGIFKGTWLTIWRVLRCNPWGGSGYDPVP